MGEIVDRWRGLTAPVVLLAVTGLLTACAGSPVEPAPVFLRGSEPMSANAPPPWRQSAPPPWRENKTVTVRRGQTLADIAHANHVPEHALIAANNLKPPYKLKAGTRLTIPDGGMAPPMQQAVMSSVPPTTIHPVPPPPSAPQVVAPRPAIPPQTAANVPPVQPPPPSSGARVSDVVPLDGPPRPVATAPPPAAPPNEPAPNLAGETPGGRFPWPLHGRILANYGSQTGNARNEGINIAAPRGTPVRSIDAGTIAYVGNEVPGYGNLVLVKHANGWISAYAHLGDITVKKGDAVGSGEIIAKVGDTGGVNEPQLHFELRRGKKPVDPKEFLEPAGSAAAKAEQKAG